MGRRSLVAVMAGTVVVMGSDRTDSEGVTMPVRDHNNGIECPGCRAHDWTTVDTRHTAQGLIRRRKQCLACGEKVTTVELRVDKATDTGRLLGLADQVEETRRVSRLMALDQIAAIVRDLDQ